MEFNCRLCGNKTERMTPIAHSQTPICDHCVKNIIEYHNMDIVKIDEEKIAYCEFKNVPDEGLFPNHTDKDIWVSGFKAAIAYIRKIYEKSTPNPLMRDLEKKLSIIDCPFANCSLNTGDGGCFSRNNVQCEKIPDQFNED